MPVEKKRRLQKRFTTPPPVVAAPGTRFQHLDTPQRSAIFAVLYFCEQRKLPASLQDLEDVFNFKSSTASNVLASGRVRRRRSKTADIASSKVGGGKLHAVGKALSGSAPTGADVESTLAQSDNFCDKDDCRQERQEAMPLTKDAIKFGTFVVTSQVFHLTRLSFALVNLKPLLPGHVLVSPRRIVPRFNDLSAAEVHDLFQTVQRVSRMVERVFNASSLNIAIQDGVDAGQSVPHVHAHIIPRRKDDLQAKGGTDAIYEMMESEGADLNKQLKEKERAAEMVPETDENRGRFPAVDNDSRKPRSEEEMQKEADWLAEEMSKDEQAAGSRGADDSIVS